MKMKEKQVTLKNGNKVTIRTLGANEVDGYLRFMHAASRETDFLTLTPEEVAAINKKDESLVIAEYEKAKKSICLAAFAGNDVVAVCIVEPLSKNERESHRALVTLAVKRELWNLGLGSSILSTGVDFAGKVGYSQIETDNVTQNVTALLLCQKYGFNPVGSFPRSLKVNGAYRDTVRFVKYLGNEA